MACLPLLLFAKLIIYFRLGLNDGAGRRVDVVIVLLAALLEVDVVVHDRVVEVEFGLEFGDVTRGEASILEGDVLGGFLADVGG